MGARSRTSGRATSGSSAPATSRSTRRSRRSSACSAHGASAARSRSRRPPSRFSRSLGKHRSGRPRAVRSRPYDGQVALSLVVGPANAGKVALLLERFSAAVDRDPYLIVPHRSDVERAERDLVARFGGLVGGSIGTFDDLFGRIARRAGARPVMTEMQQTLLLRRATSQAALNGLSSSARSQGFVDALRDAVRELGAALVSPDELDGDLGRLYAAYRAELDRLALWDRDLLRAHAVQRLEGGCEPWQGQPVFAYGFEDLTAAEWRLVQALAGRAEVTVSLPYEPGRPAFAALRDTADGLSALARGRIDELPPRYGEIAPPALAHLERS